MFNKFSRKILPDVTISKLIRYVISQSVDPKISVLTRGLISHARYSKLMYLSLWFTKVFQGGGETISMFINLHLQRIVKECTLFEGTRTDYA